MGIPRVYWYVLLIVMLETLAMGCFKRSIDNNAFFALGVLFYAAVGYLLRLTMNDGLPSKPEFIQLTTLSVICLIKSFATITPIESKVITGIHVPNTATGPLS